MTASNTPDRSVSDDALASGGPAGNGGFDPSRPFTTRSGLVVTNLVHRGWLGIVHIGGGQKIQSSWNADGSRSFGNPQNPEDLINTPTPTVAPTPAVAEDAGLYSPLQIQIAMHYHCMACEWQPLSSAAQDIIASMLACDLLTSPGPYPGMRYGPTPKLKEWVRRILSVRHDAVPPTPARDMAGEAHRYALSLAKSLHAKHYPDVPQWKPLEDLIGILTQIDNMTTALAREGARREPVASNDGWQPIETAPKDGAEILLAGCTFGPHVRIGHWGAGRYDRSIKKYERDWTDGASFGFAPKHWRPLPAAPSSTNQPKGGDAPSKTATSDHSVPAPATQQTAGACGEGVKRAAEYAAHVRVVNRMTDSEMGPSERTFTIEGHKMLMAALIKSSEVLYEFPAAPPASVDAVAVVTAIQEVLASWQRAPGGSDGPKAVADWLYDDMAKAIKGLRAAQQSGEARS